MKRAAVLLLVLGCESQRAPSGLEEPLRARGAQFIEGELPTVVEGPVVTSVVTQNAVLLSGQGAKVFSGRAQDVASSIAVRFAEIGTGYWVFPLGGPDPQFPGELVWNTSFDFAPSAPPGLRTLLFAAIDAGGRAGPSVALSICVASSLPDNLHVCDPNRAPPAVVVSLAWDRDADLDLVLVSADGQEMRAKTAPRSGDTFADRDSLASCVPDNTRTEHIVFTDRPRGRFAMYASLFDACGEHAVRFTAEVYEAENGSLVRKAQRSGTMIDLDANAGQDRGLFVFEHEF